jgi:putative tryptophan/tyrosine transport system substrate-binding protein
VPVQAGNPQEIEDAFATFAKERAQAVMVITDALYFAHRQRLAELALRHRLASLVPLREYVEAGGLMSYGEALGEFYRRTAYYVAALRRRGICYGKRDQIGSNMRWHRCTRDSL